MGVHEGLKQHLETGATTTCHCWLVERSDGRVLAFTDHDQDLAFDGVVFKADGGMTARALQQSTGLAVDNSEAIGALSHAAIDEKDIAAGRFDDAGVAVWLVNWRSPDQRLLLMRGSIGQITRSDGAFSAELRGISEALNKPRGRLYHAECGAVLGDASCGFDLNSNGYAVEAAIVRVTEAREFRFDLPSGFEAGWFQNGRVEVLSGPASGLRGLVQKDEIQGDQRVVTLWDGLRAEVFAGDTVKLTAGCDRQAATCRLKFNNFLNFRGFPHIPGDDWLMAYPSQGDDNDGGSRA